MSDAPSVMSLSKAQLAASDPEQHVRLSASAGTGKTQVLTARVLRLLLSDVAPHSILCLTFTKAGAAEMAHRIHKTLGQWATMKEGEVAFELRALGVSLSPEMQTKARELFAKVLDARGAGLRIQTIHSFCQSLLGAFPAEAGISPGFEALEERDAATLAEQALAEMLAGYALGDLTQEQRFARLVAWLGSDNLRKYLAECAKSDDWAADLPNDAGMLPFVYRSLIGITDVPTAVTEGVTEIANGDIEALKTAFANWRKKDGDLNKYAKSGLETLTAWQTANVSDRSRMLLKLSQCWNTKEGGRRTGLPQDTVLMALIERLDKLLTQLIPLQAAQEIGPYMADALIVGRDYARAYSNEKIAAGVLDFGDLIARTAALLRQPDIGAWIRFKLDQSIDHVLVDEAQDTNAMQWDIIKVLVDDYFSGDGAKEGLNRTLFMVGDFKQAIFSFQGTDPREFEEATNYFAKAAERADAALLRPTMNDSYRSTAPILALTDKIIEMEGAIALGITDDVPQHSSKIPGGGTITVWDPIVSDGEGENDGTDDADSAEESWISDADLRWADRLAKKVKSWIEGGLYLQTKARNAEAGDVMILLRSRGELARLIVSRLFEAGVPVEGVDRLYLNKPIAVQDLLACIRFALQPADSLSLAGILVSPLVGWSQQQLYDHAKREKGALWPHLRASLAEGELAVPYRLLAMADMSTPYRFLEAILSGPIGGRRKLIERLGEEARDPIEEFLNLALVYEQGHCASLQGFLDWFETNEEVIKRDTSKAAGKVRVMSAHGAKGLQAPIVVLADATRDSKASTARTMDWVTNEGLTLPMFRPAKALRVGSMATSALDSEQRAAEEHMRLLYVAMTRAEEQLFVGGSAKTSKDELKIPESSWYAKIESAVALLGGEKQADALIWHVEGKSKNEKPGREVVGAQNITAETLPNWACTMAPPEARPPKPLAPTALGVTDDEAMSPIAPEQKAAALRGTLLHSLFERLPAVPSEKRRKIADLWLERTKGITDKLQREELVESAIRIIDAPEYADIFGPDALAEAPLSGVVNGQVISGTVDRLLVGQGKVKVVDFKTGRYVPDTPGKVARRTLAQISAYVAVLQGMFPDHQVEAAILYTSGPKLLTLPPDQIEPLKPGFMPEHQDLAVEAIVYAPLNA